jgi:transcriptional regulator with XRE-family HTH domain
MRSKGQKDNDYERLLAQERLILDATETIVGLLEEQGVSRQELAKRLGKSKGFVSQLLSGERNMTLRSLADLGHALGRSFSVVPNSGEHMAQNADAIRSVYAAFVTPQAEYQWISPDLVDQRRRKAEDFSVNVRDYHECPLVA